VIETIAALLVGLGVGRLLWGPKPKPLRMVRFDYSPPVAIEPPADVERWCLYLASFGLQCALAGVTSEAAVVKAGIVDGETDYRAYAGLMRRYGVWMCRGRRSRTRWVDRHPLAGVGRLRDAIKRGRVVPRWPSPTPPLVRAVSCEKHAGSFVDVAEFAEFAD